MLHRSWTRTDDEGREVIESVGLYEPNLGEFRVGQDVRVNDKAYARAGFTAGREGRIARLEKPSVDVFIWVGFPGDTQQWNLRPGELDLIYPDDGIES
ncbi:MAG TPA: hypothetical protein VJG67_01660 [Candidatus Paceibacterota bacterium]